ncbi:MAG: MOP flippase family protein [Desulfobacula sp.]|nr:MOP flippase family protein [Desulfobacula sp.]
MSNDNLKQQAVRGTKWTACSALLVTILQLARIIVLGRLLSPDDFGLMAMMLVVIGFAQIFREMGLGSAIIQRPNPTRNELSTIYWANIVLGMTVYFILLIATPLVASFYKTDALKAMLPIVAITFLVIPWGNQFRVLLQKELKFRSLSCIEVFSATVGTVASIYMAWSGLGVWSLIYGQLVDSIFRTLALCWIGWRMNTWPKIHFAAKDLSGYLKFGLNQVGAMTVNYFNSRADQLVIGAVLGAEALGLYSMAFNLVMMPVQKINPIFTRIAFPVLAKIQGDRVRLKRWYIKMLNILTSLNAPVLIGFAIVAPIVIPIMLGSKWISIIPVVQILCVFSLIRSTGNPGGSLLLAVGRPDVEFYWNLGLLFLVPGTVFVSGMYGGTLVAVALALLGLQTSLFFPWYFLILRKILGPCALEYTKALGVPVIIVAGMYCLLSFCRAFLDQPISLLVFQVVAGVVIYSAGILIWQKELVRELKAVFYNLVK